MKQEPTPLEEIERALRAGLATPLPGPAAQKRMTPRWMDPPPFARPQFPFPENGVPAGALLLLFPVDGVSHLLLTVRSRELPTHRGQVSLPGGMQEEGEELVDTALREAWEEVGIEPGQVQVLGALSPLFIPPSQFILHPYVGTLHRPFVANLSSEVERVIQVPLEAVADPRTVERETRIIRGARAEVPYFSLGGEKVWGATAMVLSEFLAVWGKMGRA